MLVEFDAAGRLEIAGADGIPAGNAEN